MGVTVAFDYATWTARYPEFASVSEPLATLYFNEATVYCVNDGSGPVSSTAIQSTLLNMLTAHIAQLNYTPTGSQPSQLVGRISSATEGSVSVQTELAGDPNLQEAFFSQTKYGMAFWRASAPYRTMRYAAKPSRVAFGGRWPYRG